MSGPYRKPGERPIERTRETERITPMYANPKWTGKRAADMAERALFVVGLVALLAFLYMNVDAFGLAAFGALAAFAYLIRPPGVRS